MEPLSSVYYRTTLSALAVLRNCYEDCFAVPGAGAAELAMAKAVRFVCIDLM
jgi:hypothetical protein